VPKSDDELLGDLQSALTIIREGAQAFHLRKERHHLINVMVQLRAIASFNPAKRGGSESLLHQISVQHGIELSLYSIPPKPRKGPPGLVGSVLASQTWSVRPQNGLVQYSLREWLLTPAYHDDSDNSFHSRNKIIREVANKTGAHYDDHVSTLTDSVRRGFGSKYRYDDFFVLDTSSAIFYLGSRLLRIIECKKAGLRQEDDKIIQALEHDFSGMRISLV